MADLITGIITAIISIVVIYKGATMPYPATFLTSPGLFPVMIGSLLLLLSILLLLRTIKSDKIKEKININLKDVETKRLIFIIAALIIFLFILIPTIGFLPAAWIFLVVFTTAFKEVKFITTLFSSSISVVFVWFVFFYLLKIPYPQ